VRGGISLCRRAALGLSLGAVAVLALGITTGPAFGLGILISANDDSGFDPDPIPAVGPGFMLQFSNMDTQTHNVTADDDGPDGKALFRTGNVPGGDQAEIKGVPFLEPGTYGFHCSIHPSTMTAELEIGGAGPGTVPRPDISAKVKSKKLEKVAKSGKLKVAVSAAEPTRAEGVSLTAKKGAKSIAKRTSLNVNPGETQTVKLRLKKKAEEKLADLDKAKVKVTAEVDFGSPAKASKKLK
jgi:plastocyanin